MTDTIADLSQRLQDLADRAAIVDAAIAYATAVDTGDWQALETLFADDACWEYSGSPERVHGPAAIVARVGASLGRFDATQHLNGNHVVVVSGDEAEHTCYVHAQHVRTGLPGGERYLAGARYEDRLRRTPDGWRFTRRRIVDVWGEGNVAVVADP